MPKTQVLKQKIQGVHWAAILSFGRLTGCFVLFITQENHVISNFRMMQSCIVSMQVATLCIDKINNLSPNHCRINKASKVIIMQGNGGVVKVASGGKGSKGSGGILRVKENNGWLGFYTILNFSHILTAWI